MKREARSGIKPKSPQVKAVRADVFEGLPPTSGALVPYGHNPLVAERRANGA